MKRIIELLLGSKRHPPVTPYCPEGNRLYCIGDIHGRVDLLEQLHTLIAGDAEDYSGQKTVIYMGDYIDRGEDSMAVIDTLVNKSLIGFDSVYLRGNHDQSLLDFLQFAEVGPGWLNHGGMTTLVSYGVKTAKIPAREEDYIELQEALVAQLPDQHLLFFQNTRMSHLSGSYYFVHAGIRPGVDLEKQQNEDLLWVREEFLAYRKNHEKIIVHGHSICDEPEVRSNRIGIDTGAYMSGRLTALVLEQDTQRFICTHA